MTLLLPIFWEPLCEVSPGQEAFHLLLGGTGPWVSKHFKVLPDRSHSAFPSLRDGRESGLGHSEDLRGVEKGEVVEEHDLSKVIPLSKSVFFHVSVSIPPPPVYLSFPMSKMMTNST